MNIKAYEDISGAAPKDSTFYTIDADTYDGAPDSRSPMGQGATPEEAIADLKAKMAALTGEFTAEDFAFLAELIRQSIEEKREDLLRATLSNSVNIILAALDKAASV